MAVIGVMGSGQEPHVELAQVAGTLIAERGDHLLTGGGAGVMASVSAAFVATPGRRGVCLGVLKGSVEGGRYLCLGGPNPHVEVPIRTHLPDSGTAGTALTSRNHVNVLSADAVVVLPGGPGTQSELELALRYRRPVVVFARRGDRVGDLTVDGDSLRAAGGEVPVVDAAAALEAFLAQALP
jgi:uncharacterized protein (TIGR00725 family)